MEGSMKFSDDELLAIVDEITITLGQLLLSHRQLNENFIEQHGIENAQAQIEKKRKDIQRIKDRITQTRDAMHRRHELEKIRKQHEKEHEHGEGRRRQAEATNGLAGVEPITDQRGRVIGYRQGNGAKTIYLNSKGQVVAREIGAF